MCGIDFNYIYVRNPPHFQPHIIKKSMYYVIIDEKGVLKDSDVVHFYTSLNINLTIISKK